MLDHVILPVSDLERAVAFYTKTLAPLGLTVRHAYEGRDGPPGHPDPRYYAANVFDPDGHGLELVFESWQHP